ncbi:MAG: hypothetical protein HOE90_23745 [Bacteriovoracaceae bacterium]|nr:hypothetical protein [Bacteriovoracaceae bacterium]
MKLFIFLLLFSPYLNSAEHGLLPSVEKRSWYYFKNFFYKKVDKAQFIQKLREDRLQDLDKYAKLINAEELVSPDSSKPPRKNRGEFFSLDKNGIAIFRLDFLVKGTAKRVEGKLLENINTKISRIVLDLRGSPGGHVDEAVDILSLFMRKRFLFKQVKRSGIKPKEYYSSKKKYFNPKTPITVLIDKKTGSASELIAMVFKHYGRGYLFGETTYGKGVVQSTFQVGKSFYIRFTTAQSIGPRNFIIHDTGISPDYTVDQIAKDGFSDSSFLKNVLSWISEKNLKQ